MARGQRTKPTVSQPRARITPGAVACPYVPLDELLGAGPATVVISDVHSDLLGLRRTLERLGLVDNAGRRSDGGRHRLLSIGDLVDGRDENDLATLEYGREVFDRVICGNHEAALLGGPAFRGLFMPEPEVRRTLEQMARSGQLTIADVAGDTLITHAGVSDAWFDDTSAADVAAALDDSWYAFLGNRDDQDGRLFAIDAARSRTGGPAGGALWGDWGKLVGQGRPRFSQIVGHSAVGAPEQTRDGSVICIDVDGPSIAAAAVGPDRHIHVGHDPTVPTR